MDNGWGWDGYDKVEFVVKDWEVFIQQFAHFYILFWNSLKREKQTWGLEKKRDKSD